MKKLAVSLLIALLSLNSFAQEADVDVDSNSSIAAENADDQAPLEATNFTGTRLTEERRLDLAERRTRAAARQRAFNLRGIELFEQAINNSARYKMTILVNGEQTHSESKNIRPDGSSGSIARSFAEQMRSVLDGPMRTDEGGRLKFRCQQDNALTQLPIFKLILKPGRCKLTLDTLTSEQRQKVTLSFVMELTNTDEHENWPSRIISPEIKLEIEAIDHNHVPHGPRGFRN